MPRLAFSLVALGLLAAPALAQTPMSFADVDTDGNGELSYTELLVAWPDITQSEFDVADVDLSGGLSANELNSLQPANMAIPAPAAPAASTAVPVPETLSNTKKD